MNIYDINMEFHLTFVCHKILLLFQFPPSVIKFVKIVCNSHGPYKTRQWAGFGPPAALVAQLCLWPRERCCCFLVFVLLSVSGILIAACFHAGVLVVIGEYCSTLNTYNIMLIKAIRKIFQISLWGCICGFSVTY